MWVVGARLVGIAATFAANILAARLLGPAAFGMYLLLITAMTLGATLGMFGLDEAGLRFVAESLGLGKRSLARAYIGSIIRNLLWTAPVAALLIAAPMSLFAGRLADFGGASLLIGLTAVGVILLVWQRVTAELLRAMGNLQLASLFSGGLTGGPISNVLLLLGLAVAWRWLGSVSLEVATSLLLASIAVALPLSLLGLRQLLQQALGETPTIQLSHHQKAVMASVGVTLLGNQLLAFGSQQLDIGIGGLLLRPEELGTYGACKRCLLLAAMPVQMAMMTVVANIPRLYAQQRTYDLERMLRSAASYAAIPALGALLLLALLPETIPQWLFGGSFSGTRSTILILVVGYLPLILLGNPPPVLAMTGRHRTVLAVNLVATLLLLLVGTLGAYYYGAVGLAVGSSVSFMTQNALLWWLAHKRLGVWTHVGRLASVTPD